MKTTDMTKGNITPLLIKFAIPVFAGSLFQQLYNTVDSIVVGNYVGKEALAAIGSTTSLINSMIGFFMGLATGAGVVISQYFGAKDTVNLRKTVHTMILGTIIAGIVVTFAAIYFSPVLLRLMNTPDDVITLSNDYLVIYFEGVIFLMLYNIGSGILRAVGDSKRPLYFLIITSIINVVLDLVFVIKFNLGVQGVAYATIISEAVSAVMVMWVLFSSRECYQLRIKELKISGTVLKRVLKIGLPGGIQMALTAFSNVFVQGYINYFGSSCMAGWASYNKVDIFALLPMQSIALANTTFTGQNYGAGNMLRVKEGVKKSLYLSLVSTFILIIPIMLFSKTFVSIFNQDKEVIYYGSYFLIVCSPFYLLCCINQIYAGALRGLGNATIPMIFMLSSFVLFRQIYLFTVTHITRAFFPVSIAYPMGWILCSALMFVYYKKYINRLTTDCTNIS